MKKTEEQKKYMREYYLRNKSKMNFESKLYREKHKEEMNAYRRNYQKENKEYLNDISRKYHMLNPDKVNEYEQRRRLKDKVLLVKKQNIRRKNNRIKYNAQQKAKRNVPMESKCQICGSTNNLQRHHWRYDKPLLVATLCKQCHAIQHINNFSKWHQTRMEADKQLQLEAV